MILPLDLLVGYSQNIYELTCAAMRRAYQISVTGDKVIEESNGKVVSAAVKQVLTQKVVFKLEE